MKPDFVVDAHTHYGPRSFEGIGGFGTVTTSEGKRVANTFEMIEKRLKEADIQGAVLIPFPEDIQRPPYATAQSAKTAHAYLLEARKKNPHLYPFYFVWNDFLIPEDLASFKGIKWHRHFWEDPEYNYDDPKCGQMLEAIADLKLPVILEESFEKTGWFVETFPHINVIVPHIGSANGGARQVIPAFKNKKNVYMDTSLAYPFQVIEAVLQFGPDRILYGSDTPYSSSKIELCNLLDYDLFHQFSDEEQKLILSGNILRLMGEKV